MKNDVAEPEINSAQGAQVTNVTVEKLSFLSPM